MRVLLIGAFVAALALFWVLDFSGRHAAQASDSTYCEMVDLWLDQGRAGVPMAQRDGWPPRGVPGRDYLRDCKGGE